MRGEVARQTKARLCVHPKTKAKLKAKLKELTSHSNGWRYEKRKEKLDYAIRGWVNYFRLAEMRNFLKETDEWLRSRLRMCIWKCCKRAHYPTLTEYYEKLHPR
ncbi:MAG: hypothetical protein HDS02_09245 [Bacteroides sp.]|nr:hypothetical protein [Bacteroides sp.]